MQSVHVKNLEKYHPGYKDRTLVWCKVYFTMLNAEPEFEMVDEIDKWRFVAFVILELQAKRPIPLEPKYLARKGFNLKKRPISLTIQMLQNFLETVDTNGKVRALDKSRIEKSRVDKDIPPTEEQINQYCKEKNIYVDAADFIQFYGSKGWKVGKSPMKDWRLAVCRAVKWEINKNQQPKPPPDKAAEQERARQAVRDDKESWLRSKTLPALKDLAADKKSHIYNLCGWLIEEILAEKQKGK